MELFVSGVKVPKLGSYADRMARDYLIKRASKEVYRDKLLVQIAQNTAGDSKEISQHIVNTWNDYVGFAYFMDDKKYQKEVDMRKEYDFWKKVRPKLKLQGKDKLTVSGIPLPSKPEVPQRPQRNKRPP